MDTLRDAIARRNVESDGRIWRSGEIVIPSAVTVRAITAETRVDMDERAKILKALRELPAAAPVSDVRAVLPVDSHEISRDGAIETYMRLQNNSRRYLKDLELARYEWARRKYV